MSSSNRGRTITQRLWAWLLSVLGLVIVANVAWALARPVVPVLMLLGLLVALAVVIWRVVAWRDRW